MSYKSEYTVMGPWCCDCEVMGFDGEDMSFMMAPSNVNIYEHRFINAIVLLRAQNEVPIRDTMETTWKWRDLVMIYKTTVHSELTYVIRQHDPIDLPLLHKKSACLYHI